MSRDRELALGHSNGMNALPAACKARQPRKKLVWKTMERETQKQKAKREAEERVERAAAHDVFISKLQVRADTSVDCVGDGSFECLKYPIKAPREKAKQCIPGDIALVHYTGWLVEPAPEGDPVRCHPRSPGTWPRACGAAPAAIGACQ